MKSTLRACVRVCLPALILLAVVVNMFGQTATPTPVQSYTDINNKAALRYTDPNTGDVIDGTTNQVVATVAPVNAIVVTPDETAPVNSIEPLTPNQIASYQVCNTGNNPYPVLVSSITPSAGLTVTAIYWDMDASGTVTPGDIQTAVGTTNSPIVQPGTCISLIAQFDTAALTAGETSNIAINVSSGATTPASTPVNDDGNRVWTNLRGAELVLAKLVNQATQVISQRGDTVTYSFALTNNGDSAARNVILTDTVAAGHTYVANSVIVAGANQTDLVDTDAAEVAGSTVTVKLPSVAAGATVVYSFQARVADAIISGSSILNQAGFSAENLSAPGVSNTTAIIVDPSAIIFNGDNPNTPIPGALVTLNGGTLPGTGFPVNSSNTNPFTTGTTGAYAFALPCQNATYTMAVTAPGFFSRNIQANVIASMPQGSTTCVFNITLTALDGQPLATAGGFTLTNGPISLNQIAGLIQNIPMFGAGALNILKTADPRTAQIGDVVTYRVAVNNNSQASTPFITLNDVMPLGFYYAEGTAQLERGSSLSSINPTVNGRNIAFPVGSLASKETVYVVYRVRVGADAKVGANLNLAQAVTPEGVRSNESVARVDILPGITSEKQFIVGKVYFDNNRDGRFNLGDEPVMKAQVVTSNGRSALTDNTGAYSIPVIGAGTQIIGLIRDSIPNGYLPKYHNAQDGEWSLLLRTPLGGGTVLTGDFPLVKIERIAPDCGTCGPNTNTTSVDTNSDNKETEKVKPAARPVIAERPTSARILADNQVRMAAKTVKALDGKKLVRFTVNDGALISTNQIALGVETVGSYKVQLFVNGEEISNDQVGETLTDYTTSAKRENYYGLNLKIGKNELTAKIANANGEAQGEATINVNVAGKAVRYEIEAEKSKLDAGGRDETFLVVRGYDENGNPADGEVVVATNAGMLGTDRTISARAEEVNPVGKGVTSHTTPSTQQKTVALSGGVGQIKLVSDYKAGNADIRVYSGQSSASNGTQAAAQTRVQFEQPAERPVIVGYGQINVGKANPQSIVSGVGTDEPVWTRSSVFTRFKVGKNAGVFTGSYQSHAPINRDETLNQIVAGRFTYRNPLFDNTYSIFGDSSDRFLLTPSNTKAFARWEKGLNYAQFGDFTPFSRKNSSEILPDGQRSGSTSTVASSGNNFAAPIIGEGPRLAGYNRNLTGLSINLEKANGDRLEIAGARPRTSFARDVLPGGSLSLASLSGNQILIGSEIVTMETRDRRSPSLVLKRTQLVRDLDYDLDYQSGRITFRRFIPLFDSELNLNQVVVSYEYEGGAESNVYLGRGVKTFGDGKYAIGGSFSSTSQGALGSFVVGGVDFNAKTPKGGNLFVEFARSNGKTVGNGNFFNASSSLDNNGFAFEATLNQPLSKAVRLNASAVIAESGFANPFAGTVQPGAVRVNGNLEVDATSADKLRFNAGLESNDYAGYKNDRLTFGAQWRRQWMPKFSTLLGYDFRSLDDSAGQFGDRKSHLLTAGLTFQPNSRTSFSLIREQNLTSDQDPSYPNNTILAADYKINDFSRAFITSRFGGSITPLTGQTGVGFSAVNSRNEVNAGIETKFGRDTSITGAYRLEEGTNGTDSFAVIGLGQRWKYSETLAFDAGVESAFKVGGNGRSYYSFYGGTTYRPNEDFIANARYERRTRIGGGDFFSAGATGKPAKDWTLLGKFQFAQADGDFDGYFRKGYYGQVGGAWRPLGTDKYGMFFQYNFRDYNQISRDNPNTTQIDRQHQFSTDAFWQPTAHWSFFGKTAFRSVTNSTNNLVPVSTWLSLYQGRGEYKFSKLFDLGLEARWIREFKTNTGRFGVAPEVGFWVPNAGLRFGVGYNYMSTQHGLNLGNEHRKGWYFSITAKADRVFDFMSGADKESGFDREEKCPERINRNTGRPCAKPRN